MKTKLRIFVAAVLLAFSSNAALALTVPVAEDTTSTKGELTSKAGRAASLTVSNDQIALLEFEIQNPDVVPDTITPSDIKSAILELYVIKTNTAANLNVLVVTGTWSESFAAKTEPPPSITSAVSGTIPVSEVPYKQFVSADITPAVVAAMKSGSNLSLAIETSTPGAKITLGSKDGPASGYAAQLFIDANLGAPADYGQLLNGNTAIGAESLAEFNGSSGASNTAFGFDALENNASGNNNVACGYWALVSNTSGNNNVACGLGALYHNTSGNQNLAIGIYSGFFLTTGSNNIDIGSDNGTLGIEDTVAGESDTIRIGEVSTQTATYIAGIYGASYNANDTPAPVYIDSTGKLGTNPVTPSSRLYKKEIKPMGDASDVILSLAPVTFHYIKPEFDPRAGREFGLIAEEVDKICPDLVAHNKDGTVYGIRYDFVNAMLLNEFLKEHARVEKLEATVAEQSKTLAQQQEEFQSTLLQQQQEIKDLTAGLKEQASLLQKVSAQIQLNRSAPQVVSNNR